MQVIRYEAKEIMSFQTTAAEQMVYSSHNLPLPERNRSERGLLENGWIGGEWRDVECLKTNRGYKIAITGIGAFTITTEGNRIAHAESWAGANPDLIREAFLGPVLTLALALQGTWCFHASAAKLNGQVVIFVGESGNGKSTLASCLNQNSGSAWRRVADDVLPVTLADSRIFALPHFPQLKLRAEDQYPLNEPERLPLGAVYVISAPDNQQEKIEIQHLTAREAMLALVRHTIASRLFDKELLARHLDFCAEVTARIPVRRLVYPRKLSLLPRVREAIEADQLKEISEGAIGWSNAAKRV
jgi:hypothetical protein